MNIGEKELNARLVFILGGRAAEKLVFDEYSAGAENDLTQCTRLARRMVTAWGMSERLGPEHYGEERQESQRQKAERVVPRATIAVAKR